MSFSRNRPTWRMSNPVYPSMAWGLAVLSKVFVVLVLLLSSTATFAVFWGAEAEAAQGTLFAQAIWLVVYLITFALIAPRWRLILRLFVRNKLLLLLVVLALASVLWSAAPEVTLRRSIALLGTTLFGFYLSARYTVGTQVRLLAWALGIAAVLSLLLALALPTYGISDDPFTPGDWRGVFDHKNNLGSSMVLGAMVFLLLATSSHKLRWLAWVCFILSLALLLLSNSVTALVVFLTLLVLLPLFRALRWRYTLAVPFLIFAVVLVGAVAVYSVSNTEIVLNTLGRDATLTGRTQLWDVVLDMIREQPWLGYGYSAFWLGLEGPSARLWLATGQEYSHAHNSFLDLWLQLGLLGVAVFSLGFVLAFSRAVIWTRQTRSTEGLWPIIFLTFVPLYSLTESAILEQNSALWIIYVATVLSTSFTRGGSLASEEHAVQARRKSGDAPLGGRLRVR
jgi:exopolysaccharide production protein ExoQ